MCTLQLMANEDMMSTFMILQNLFHTRVIKLLCLLLVLDAFKKQSKQIQISSSIKEQRERVQDAIMKWIISIEKCRDNSHGSRAFINLYALLKDDGYLQPT